MTLKMKKSIISLGIAALLLIVGGSLHSCGLVDFDHSENGQLDGYWHLVSVDSLHNGAVTDLSQQRFFWGVQGTLLQFYSPDIQGTRRFVSQFTHQDNRLTVSEVRYDQREKGDPVVENISEIAPFGLNSITEVFQIDNLSGRSMTLSNNALRLRFKKM